MLRIGIVLFTLLFVGCAVDTSAFDRARILDASSLQTNRISSANVEIVWAEESMGSGFMARMQRQIFGGAQDLSLHARPVVSEALTDAGVRSVLGDGAVTVKVTVATSGGSNSVAGWRRPYWKNVGMDFAFVGLVRNYYDVYSSFVANYQVIQQGRVIYDSNFTADSVTAYNLSQWNFGSKKILGDRSRDLFLAELTKTTLSFVDDFNASGPVVTNQF